MKYHTFLQRFHSPIRCKSKQTTIRGRTLIKPGEIFALRHWSAKAYRSPMGYLGTAECQSLHSIRVSWSDTGRPVTFNGTLLAPHEADLIARRDGFENAVAMMNYFDRAGKLNTEMTLIDWGMTFKEFST